jgi:hypothetical protein
MPHWNQKNLTSHYQKHPDGSCALCWANLLGHPPPISLKVYEEESLAHINKAAMSFGALYKKTNHEKASWRQYFVNEKLIFTVVIGSTDEVATSFRWHRHHQDHSTDCSLATWLRMIERLADKRFAMEGQMTDFRNINSNVKHLSPKEREVVKIASKKLTMSSTKWR